MQVRGDTSRIHVLGGSFISFGISRIFSFSATKNITTHSNRTYRKHVCFSMYFIRQMNKYYTQSKQFLSVVHFGRCLLFLFLFCSRRKMKSKWQFCQHPATNDKAANPQINVHKSMAVMNYFFSNDKYGNFYYPRTPQNPPQNGCSVQPPSHMMTESVQFEQNSYCVSNNIFKYLIQLL